MKLFMGFIVATFIMATVLRRYELRINQWMVFGLAICLSIAYFFFNQI
ncbi:hypothetical protein [Kouleothrix sp.]|mgnify:CR=1 FL=1